MTRPAKTRAASSDALEPRNDHREDPRVERLLRRAAVFADWNPRWPLARPGMAHRAVRDGVWPSTNAAKRPFGGSFDAAVRAAGRSCISSAALSRAGVAVRRWSNVRRWHRAVSTRRRRRPHAPAPWSVVSPNWSREVARRPSVAECAEACPANARTRCSSPSERERRAGMVAELSVGSAWRPSRSRRGRGADARVRAAYDQAEAAVADTQEARRPPDVAEVRACSCGGARGGR